MEMWKASKEIVDQVQGLIKKHHPDLAIVMDEIAVIFRETAAKRGGRVILGKTSKASPLIANGILSDAPWKFIIELPADEWEKLTSRQKEALLDRHLCACRTEVNDKTGETKYLLASPDVAYYWDEIDRWGDWYPRDEEDKDKPNIVKLLSGQEEEEEIEEEEA